MKVLIRSGYLSIAPEQTEDQFLFLSTIPPHRLGILPLVISTAFHAFASVVFMVVSPYLFSIDPDTVNLARFKVEPLRLTLNEPFYLPIPLPAERKRPEPVKPPSPPARAAAATSAAQRQLQAQVPEQFELPKPRRAALPAPVILQPEFDPTAAPPKTATPSLAFWARQAPDLPKPPRNDVTPGRVESSSSPAKPAAPPIAAVPNREPVIAELNVAMPPTPTVQAPKLQLPNSATVPVKARDLAESHAASFESITGQAVNVLAIARDRKDVRKVEIPHGFQNVPEPRPADGAGAGKGKAPGPLPVDAPSNATNTARNEPVRTASNNPSNGAANSSPNNAANNPPARSAATPPAPTPSPAPATTSARAESRPFDQAPPAQNPASPPPSARRAEANVTRINHPVNGNFDVVITQAAVREDIPDLAGMLSGTPVYSVYLQVGDRKEWLLEYCVPPREAVQSNPYMVNIDDEGTITPPYPISTAVPSVGQAQQLNHIVLRGRLTAAGDLKIAKASDPNNAFVTHLLALVSEWRFRPALRNKRPIDVDFILVIPPHA